MHPQPIEMPELSTEPFYYKNHPHNKAFLPPMTVNVIGYFRDVEEFRIK